MLRRRQPVPEPTLLTDQQVEDRIRDEIRCSRAEQLICRRSGDDEAHATERLDSLLESLAALHARP